MSVSAHLYMGLAGIAVGRIGDFLPDPTGQYLVPQVEAPGRQVRVREENPSGQIPMPRLQGPGMSQSWGVPSPQLSYCPIALPTVQKPICLTASPSGGS